MFVSIHSTFITVHLRIIFVIIVYFSVNLCVRYYSCYIRSGRFPSRRSWTDGAFPIAIIKERGQARVVSTGEGEGLCRRRSLGVTGGAWVLFIDELSRFTGYFLGGLFGCIFLFLFLFWDFASMRLWGFCMYFHYVSMHCHYHNCYY